LLCIFVFALCSRYSTVKRYTSNYQILALSNRRVTAATTVAHGLSLIGQTIGAKKARFKGAAQFISVDCSSFQKTRICSAVHLQSTAFLQSSAVEENIQALGSLLRPRFNSNRLLNIKRRHTNVLKNKCINVKTILILFHSWLKNTNSIQST
jgi:hypothetical protein